MCSCTGSHFRDSHSTVPVTAHPFPLNTPHEQGHCELSVVRLFKSTLAAVNSAIMYAFLFAGCGCSVFV